MCTIDKITVRKKSGNLFNDSRKYIGFDLSSNPSQFTLAIAKRHEPICFLFWLGWVLRHINHCMLFNAKFSFYIYIIYIGFGLIGFYSISTIVGYLMPNPLDTCILNIYKICKHMLEITFLNKPDIFQWFQVFQYNNHNLTSVIC